jgi:hypothetical protein
MQTRAIVGLCLIPIALLITAGTLNVAGGVTIPAIAI